MCDSDGLPLTLLVLTPVSDNVPYVVDVIVEDRRPLCELSADGLKDVVSEPIALVEGNPDSPLLADTEPVTELEGALLSEPY